MLTEYSNKDLIGRRLLDFIHLEDYEKVIYEFDNLLKTSTPYLILRYNHKEGHFICIESNCRQFIDNDGEIKFLTISRDITKRKIAEDNLKESEEKYRLISESANDLIRVLNDRFEFEYINENVHKRLLGYTEKDLIGQTHLPFIHPEDIRHAIRSTVKNLKRGKGSYEVRFKDKYGNYRWFEFADKYFYDSKGQKKILSIARDINDRKLAEEKLRESEEKYRLISETAYDLIGVLNKKFKFEYMNSNAFQQILGYTEEDIIGKSALQFIHPGDLTRVTKIFLEGFKQGEGETELRFRHKVGHWIWVESKGKTFIDKDGNKKAIIISRDITERKKTEKALILSEDKYHNAFNRANFYKDLFTHDINNILHIINSSADLIPYNLGGLEESKLIKNISNIIQKQVERGAKLVHNVNTLSKLEEEKVHTYPTEICKLMEQSIEFVNKAYNDKNINISINCNLDHLNADANELL